MTKNTVNETERMVVTRVFDAPRALVWEAWTNPKYVMQWWGPKGFTAPFCEMDFRVGGKFLCCMRAPDGQEGWNNETMENAKNSGQVEGWNQILDKVAAVVAGLAQAK